MGYGLNLWRKGIRPHPHPSADLQKELHGMSSRRRQTQSGTPLTGKEIIAESNKTSMVHSHHYGLFEEHL
ncbi:hypothetical protein V2G26_014731 [Clonostachys chloroleuca]